MKNTIQTKKTESFRKKLFVCMLVCFALLTVGVFAQSNGTIAELEEKAELIMELFSGKIIAIIMCVALMICFAIIAWGNAQGEGASTIKKVMPWVIAVIGIGSAAGITSYFLGVRPN